MAPNTQNEILPEGVPEVLETLAKLSSGEITLMQAAVTLEKTVDDLVEFIEENPELVAQADACADQRKMDPQKVITQSLAGLGAAVSVLVERIQREGSDMATSELLQSAKTLESLIGFAKARESEIKAGTEIDEAKYPLLIQDTRQDGLRLYMIPPTSPMWVNTQLPEFQAPGFSWLNQFAPLSPAGEILSLRELLAGHVRVMTDTGLVLGGA